MVSGMTDDIIFQKSRLWAKSKKGLYCANEQFDDVIKCDLAVGMSYKNEVWQHILISVESKRYVVTNDDAETTFLLNLLYRIVASEFVPCLPQRTAITRLLLPMLSGSGR